MKLLVQGDDFGFTKAVTYGILEAIDNGILTCTGMFTNMEIAPWAAKFIKDRPNFCFGVDFNLVSGPSISDPKKIPNLVDKDGNFIRSGVRVADSKWKTKEGRAELFPYKEVYIEVRAQFDRFVELTGKKPGYLHPHSIMPETVLKAIKQVSKEEDVPFSMDLLKDFFLTHMIPDDKSTDASFSKVFNAEAQIKKDPLGKFMKNKDEVLKHEYVAIMGQPGYLDADLLNLTTLSIERVKDLEFVTSSLMKEFIKKYNVKLIDYYDLV